MTTDGIEASSKIVRKEEEYEKEIKELYRKYAIKGVLAAVAIFALYMLWFHGFEWRVPDKMVDRGLFGDTFGGLNAIYSGVALILLVVSLFVQRYEVRLLVEELSETRNVQSRQVDQSAAQNKLLRFQRIESLKSRFLEQMPAITLEITQVSGQQFHMNEDSQIVLPIAFRGVITNGSSNATAFNVRVYIELWNEGDMGERFGTTCSRLGYVLPGPMDNFTAVVDIGEQRFFKLRNHFRGPWVLRTELEYENHYGVRWRHCGFEHSFEFGDQDPAMAVGGGKENLKTIMDNIAKSLRHGRRDEVQKYEIAFDRVNSTTFPGPFHTGPEVSSRDVQFGAPDFGDLLDEVGSDS